MRFYESVHRPYVWEWGGKRMERGAKAEAGQEIIAAISLVAILTLLAQLFRRR